MDERRFELEWDRPSLPGASTHVSLFADGKEPLHVVASGHGQGAADALDDLLKTLKENKASSAAIAFVSDEYVSLGGRVPARSR